MYQLLYKFTSGVYQIISVKMESNNTTNQSCFSEYEDPKYDAVLGLRSGLSFVSCVFIAAVILIIIVFKKYYFFTQKLILYLAISNMCYLLAAGFNLSGQVAYRNTIAHGYCIFIGFCEQLTIWWTLMATACIMFNLFVTAVFGKSTERFGICYIFFIFIFPVLFCWIPFIHLSYGPDNVICWIREFNLNDCTSFKFGMWLRFSLYYFPLFVLMSSLTVFYVPVLCIVKRKQTRWAGKYDPIAIATQKMIATEIRSLIYYPLIVVLVNVIPFVREVYTIVNNKDDVYFALCVASYVVYPFQGLLVTLAFVIDPETRNMLTLRNIYAALVRCCTTRNTIRHYPVENACSDSLYSSTYSKYKSYQSLAPAIPINEDEPY